MRAEGLHEPGGQNHYHLLRRPGDARHAHRDPAARLSGPDGRGAVPALLPDRTTAEDPVILLSAEGDRETKSQGLSLGAADYLAKASSAQELMASGHRPRPLPRRKQLVRPLRQPQELTV